MRIWEVLEILDSIAPFCLAEPWDHCGLRVGDPDSNVHRIAVALDPLPSVLEEAAKRECDLLVTHHPLIFSPLSDLILKGATERAVAAALRHGIAVAACHTCWDSAVDGVNAVLAGLAGLQNWKPLSPAEAIKGCGLGAVGDLPEEMGLGEAADHLGRCWRLSGFRVLGETEKGRRGALCGGSGGDLWPLALQSGADLYATADLRYHECQEILDRGLSLMLCDHGEMEELSMRRLSEKLAACSGIPVALLPSKPMPGQWCSLRNR